jgi:hypothetical protein
LPTICGSPGWGWLRERLGVDRRYVADREEPFLLHDAGIMVARVPRAALQGRQGEGSFVHL